MSDPHAVRWYRRKVRGEEEWTKWHWTTDANFTVCGRMIPLAIEAGSFVPDTDERADKVECIGCRVQSEYKRESGAAAPYDS